MGINTDFFNAILGFFQNILDLAKTGDLENYKNSLGWILPMIGAVVVTVTAALARFIANMIGMIRDKQNAAITYSTPDNLCVCKDFEQLYKRSKHKTKNDIILIFVLIAGIAAVSLIPTDGLTIVIGLLMFIIGIGSYAILFVKLGINLCKKRKNITTYRKTKKHLDELSFIAVTLFILALLALTLAVYIDVTNLKPQSVIGIIVFYFAIVLMEYAIYTSFIGSYDNSTKTAKGYFEESPQLKKKWYIYYVEGDKVVCGNRADADTLEKIKYYKLDDITNKEISIIDKKVLDQIEIYRDIVEKEKLVSEKVLKYAYKKALEAIKALNKDNDIKDLKELSKTPEDFRDEMAKMCDEKLKENQAKIIDVYYHSLFEKEKKIPDDQETNKNNESNIRQQAG